jgi:hypothetical protein
MRQFIDYPMTPDTVRRIKEFLATEGERLPQHAEVFRKKLAQANKINTSVREKLRNDYGKLTPETLERLRLEDYNYLEK